MEPGQPSIPRAVGLQPARAYWPVAESTRSPGQYAPAGNGERPWSAPRSRGRLSPFFSPINVSGDFMGFFDSLFDHLYGKEEPPSAEVPPAPITITSISQNSLGQPLLIFDSTAGLSYQLETSTDLQIWTTVGAPVIASGASTEITDAISPVVNARFYRIHQI